MPQSAKPTVVAQSLSKDYRLNSQGSDKILVQRQTRTVQAVKPLSFVAYSGESIGVLGKNGSGKSTLLRLIAGTEQPTTGRVLVSAQPTLLGVSAALQQKLSGRQNIRLGLLAMGLGPDQVRELEQEIIDWADLSDAIDRPMRTFSSGMNARLKFAIATAVRAEILLVDEALSTGDSTFAAKAQRRMDEFLEASGTVFLVSHAASTIEKNCDRAIWLHQGDLITDGKPSWVVTLYRRWSRAVSAGKDQEASAILEYTKRKYTPVHVEFG
ncbi:ABC transporter ATP-binding protein [Corynebacterium imitans]|uniref:ABC transporter ATP-binding protein n=1 Tax=Corynebacterium imitans TaxID=156978 RepID=A0A240A5E8_9CORY|nr:ABC transporter ATP-binding protein [Corynebacterium imitans]SNV78116.1 ABC transporter ATP-binding protein [Corynebacterium imitans]